MITSIITVGTKTPHSNWGVSYDTFKIAGRTRMNYFLQSEDTSFLQKVKLGGSKKYYENDGTFDGVTGVTVGKMEDREFYSCQNIELPFSKVGINPKNLNPYLADINGESSRDRMIVILLDNQYVYERSIVNHNLAEVVCTFHTNNYLGCILRMDTTKIVEDETGQPSLNFMMIDAMEGNQFVHFHINVSIANHDVILRKTPIKKPEVIKKLKSIDEKFAQKKLVRRFVRANTEVITSYFVHPASMTEDELLTIIEGHGVSESLTTGPLFYTFYPVNIDEKGNVISDEHFKDVLEEMKEDKIKAFNLINCKISKNLFESIKPLYIFSFDATEKISEEGGIKPIICVKSN